MIAGGGLIAAAVCFGMPTAFADDTTYNPFLDRPALFDGPGTSRQALREAGVDIQASWTQFFQGVHGNGNDEWESGGKGDLIVNLDGEKLGL